MTIRDLGVEIGVDIDESPFSDLNREIDELTDLIQSIDISTIDDMERELRLVTGEFDDLNGSVMDVDNSISDIDSGNIEDIGGKSGIAEKAMDGLKLGALAVAGAIAGIATSIGMFASEADEAFGRLQAQTGATGDDLVALKGAVNDTFTRGYGESLQEVTDATARVRQNIHGLNDAELSDVTSNALLLANVFDSDVNEVARGVNNTMEAFGVTSEKAFDLFTAGGQRGLNFSDEMFDNVAEYAPLFGTMGYSAEEYFGILERGSKAGVYNLGYVNDIMKEFQIRVKDGSKATSDAMGGMSKETQNVWKQFLKGEGTVAEVSSTIIDELKTMDDQVYANQIAVSLFGTKFEDLEADAVYAMLGTTEAMTGFEGSTASAADAIEGTFKNRLTGAWRELQTGINEVVNNPTSQEFFDKIATKAEELVPKIIGASEQIIAFGSDLVDSFDDAKQKATDFYEKYDFIILGVLGSIVAWTVITGAMALYTGAASLAAGATTLLAGAIAFLTSPIGLIVVGIGAAIAIGVLLWKNWDTVKEKAALLGGWLSEKFSLIKSSISNALEPVIGMFDRLMGKWDSFKEKVSNFSIGGAVKKVASFIPGFSSGIGRVPGDMVAEIHKDEAIIPSDAAQNLRDMGVIDGDGRYPNINYDNLRGGIASTYATKTNNTSVQAPVNIIVQGGNTNAETGQSIREALEDFFADLGAVMPQVREG